MATKQELQAAIARAIAAISSQNVTATQKGDKIEIKSKGQKIAIAINNRSANLVSKNFR